jgi:hypothetical protein
MAERKQTVNKRDEPKGVARAGKQAGKTGKGRVRREKAVPKAVVDEGRAAVVKKLLRKLEKQMGGGEVKASLGDYIRLVQLHKELDAEAAREIKVTWVDPAGDKTGSKESGGEP